MNNDWKIWNEIKIDDLAESISNANLKFNADGTFVGSGRNPVATETGHFFGPIQRRSRSAGDIIAEARSMGGNQIENIGNTF